MDPILFSPTLGDNVVVHGLLGVNATNDDGFHEKRESGPSTAILIGSSGIGGGENGGDFLAVDSHLPVHSEQQHPSGNVDGNNGGEGSTVEKGGDGLDEADEANESVYEMTVFADYPEPLTEPQRRSLQRHVSQALRKYNVLHRTSRLIRRGLASLESLVGRLRKEKEALQAQLRDAGSINNNNNNSTGTSSTSPESRSNQSVQQPPAKAAKTEGKDDAVASPAPTPAKRPNRFGGLLRSAAFANLQKVLTVVQKEETEKFAHVAETRERIARETRLTLITADLASQEAVLAPLLEKQDKCSRMEKEAEAELATCLQWMSDMFREEAKYAACFTLKAVDASAAVDALRHPGTEKVTFSLPTVSSTYEIPFMPAVCTAEIEDLIRGQLEEVIEEYRAFRAQVDPILALLEEKEKERQAKRLDELMNVIGVANADVLANANGILFDPSTMIGKGLLGNGEGQQVDGDGSATHRRPGRPGRRIKAGFGVSDSDEVSDSDADSEDSLASFGGERHHTDAEKVDASRQSLLGDRQSGATASASGALSAGVKRSREDDEMSLGDAVTVAGGTSREMRETAATEGSGSDRDQKDRKLIQSALSALDDFDELF